MDLLTLIGDTDENFYQLGLMDRESARAVHSDVKRMLSTPWKPLNIALEETAKVVLRNSLLKKTEYYDHLKAYADGMGIALEEAAYIMFIPEIVSCMTKWAPGLIKGNLGCSSFIMRNDNQEVVHGRILDFPLQGSYDLNERAILYDFKGMPRMLGFGASGIPFPSITLMTEDGITLSLHQKFTNVFNKDGISIFSLIFDMLSKARDRASVMDYLKNHESITTWSLYMSFKNGDVLAADIMGKEIYANKLEVPDKGILYFCNHLENKSINQEDMLPPGFHQYNIMREEIAGKKIAHMLSKGVMSESALIAMMATPYDQKMKTKGHYENYKMDNITPSSLTVMTMNPTSAQCLYIDGEAPKVFRDNILHITDCFDNPVQKPIKIKKSKPVSEDYYEGIKSLMKAQQGFDLHDPQLVYHYLQFAIDHLENYPEQVLGKFYFLVAQYMFETHQKVLTSILHDFKNLEGHLPVNLNDHCLLFIGRLERILQLPHTMEEDKIRHPKLRNVHTLELKIPRAIFHASTKGMIVPRLDIIDVIYAYIY
ncbi:MAG: hypothetical protein WC635_14905 [Bacteriovorax sp.]|jgi:hypothetical protein